MNALPPSPVHSFASDNAAGAHPAVLDAMSEANRGSALAYGNDDWTRRAEEMVADLVGAPAGTLLCWGGTGANIAGLAALVQPWEAIVTVDYAHVVVDEGGGPSRFTGSAILTVPHAEGKLTPEGVERYAAWRGVEHHPQPAVATISQSTEMGTVYSTEEIGILADTCHRHGMALHVDGARIANALVAENTTLREMIRDTGVDVLTFGFTKNGALYGEAVVFLRGEADLRARVVRKQAGQLVSKSRFASAQIVAMLTDDLWLRNARHANDMARLLADRLAEVPRVRLVAPPRVNAVFATIPWEMLGELQAWSFFWPWIPEQSMVRWMTSFQTTPEDVDLFASGLAAILG